MGNMAIEHSYKEYQKRKQKEKEILDRSNDQYGPRPGGGAPQFQPRAVKVKKERESPEMDFKTRMKMMQNSKAAPKKTIFGIKKEDPDIKEEPGVKRKKKRRKRYSSSDDS